jgi:diketogulonate reductase-like aldo/keto reductase
MIAIGILFMVLEKIAEVRLKTIGQVVLNWVMTRDECIIPIPGAKNRKQAIENIGALGWALTAEERDRIEQAELASR